MIPFPHKQDGSHGVKGCQFWVFVPLLNFLSKRNSVVIPYSRLVFNFSN